MLARGWDGMDGYGSRPAVASVKRPPCCPTCLRRLYLVDGVWRCVRHGVQKKAE